MPKRNLLRIIQDLDGRYDPLSRDWEAWECRGSGGEDDVDSWCLATDGTLDECMSALTNWISAEVDNKFHHTSQFPDSDVDKCLREFNLSQQKRRAEIRRQCIAEGKAKSDTAWAIVPWSIMAHPSAQSKYRHWR